MENNKKIQFCSKGKNGKIRVNRTYNSEKEAAGMRRYYMGFGFYKKDGTFVNTSFERSV